MGAKSKGKKRQVHPTMSFEQAVAIATARAVQSDVKNAVATEGEALLRTVRADFEISFQYVLNRLKAITDLVLEKFGISEDEINERVLAVEDEVNGYVGSNEAAAIEDRVRFKIRDVAQDVAPQAIKLDRLGTKPQQLHEEIENALLGMKAGDNKTITIKLGTEQKEFTFEINMKRVSKKVAKNEEAAQTQAQEPAANG